MKEIKLTKGFVAFVEDKDFERVNAHKWYASIESRGTKIYAKRRRKKSDDPKRWKSFMVRMHHFVKNITPSELPPDHILDHDDGDSLNNCGSNLIVRTQTENMNKVDTWKKKPQVEPSL